MNEQTSITRSLYQCQEIISQIETEEISEEKEYMRALLKEKGFYAEEEMPAPYPLETTGNPVKEEEQNNGQPGTSFRASETEYGC